MLAEQSIKEREQLIWTEGGKCGIRSLSLIGLSPPPPTAGFDLKVTSSVETNHMTKGTFSTRFCHKSTSVMGWVMLLFGCCIQIRKWTRLSAGELVSLFFRLQDLVSFVDFSGWYQTFTKKPIQHWHFAARIGVHGGLIQYIALFLYSCQTYLHTKAPSVENVLIVI